MWLLVYVLSGLEARLQSKRRLAALLSDVAPSVCRFWFSGGLAWEERANLPCFPMWLLVVFHFFVKWRAC